MTPTKNWHSLLNRRDFMWLNAQAGLALLLSRCAHRGPVNDLTLSPSNVNFLKDVSPIDRSLSDQSEAKFYGDNNSRAHRILWNLPAYLAEKKVVSEEEAPVVIVGGGASGLFSTYQYRKYQPIILEQAARFGGNAKGQSWRGLDYSIGSAYINYPPKNSPMESWYDELGFKDIVKTRTEADLTELNGKIYTNFYEAEVEPSFKHQYDAMNRFFSELCAEKNQPFPFIPSLNDKHLTSVKHFDSYNLHGLLTEVMGGRIPPHLEAAIEYYCWSTYAASAKEISAAAALNFLAQETAPVNAAPGGNAGLAERILERIVSDVPQKNLRVNSIVVQVKVVGDGVHVLYEDGAGSLRLIKARAAILCCPKFVAAKILDGIEPERKETIAKLRYRSYMTASLLLKTRVPGKYFDMFMTQDGKTDYQNMESWQDRINATDFILANFARPESEVSVLTLYRAFPYDGARAQLYAPNAYASYRKKFETQIERQILPLLKLKPSDVADLRLALFGHALPLAAQGLFSDGTIDQLRKPFKDRVFFVEQDNWSYPSFQTGATEIALMKQQIDRVLSHNLGIVSQHQPLSRSQP